MAKKRREERPEGSAKASSTAATTAPTAAAIDRPRLGTSSLANDPAGILNHLFTGYFFVACWWNNRHRRSGGVRYSADDPNLANILMVLLLGIFWVVRHAPRWAAKRLDHNVLAWLVQAVEPLSLVIMAAALFGVGVVRHIDYSDLYAASPTEFIPGAWIWLCCIHTVGGLILCKAARDSAAPLLQPPSLWLSMAGTVLTVALLVPLFMVAQPAGGLHLHPARSNSRYISVDDGTRLAADVYLPATGEKHSVVVQLTRYGRSYQTAWPFNRFQLFGTADPTQVPGPGVGLMVPPLVNAGFAVVVVDARGTGASFGVRSPVPLHPREARDGSAVAAWVTKQPWSDGRIGIFGIGLDGAAAALAASHGDANPVAAAALLNPVLDPYADFFAPGGVPFTTGIGETTLLARAAEGRSSEGLAEMADSVSSAWSALLLRWAFAGVAPVDGFVDAQVQVAADHAQNKDIVASQLSNREIPLVQNGSQKLTFTALAAEERLVRGLKRRQIPVYSAADYFSGTAPTAAARLHAQLGTQGRLVLGPWVSGIGSGGQGLAGFFQCALLQQCAGNFSRKAVIFQNGQEWESSTEWPLRDLHWHKIHLGINGTLRSTPTKDNVNPVELHKPQWAHSSDASCQSRWKTAASLFTAIPIDNTACSPGVTQPQTHFSSEPLQTNIKMAGTAVLSFQVTGVTGRADIAAFAYLRELLPSGETKLVSSGHSAVAHRISAQSNNTTVGGPIPFERTFSMKSHQLTNGEDNVKVALEPVVHTFHASSRIELVLSSGDPHFANMTENWMIQLQGSQLSLPVRS